MAIDDTAHRKLMYQSEHVPFHGHEKEYLISLGVFQELECLVRLSLYIVYSIPYIAYADSTSKDVLRQALYPTRYNSSVITADGKVDYFAWNKLGN